MIYRVSPLCSRFRNCTELARGFVSIGGCSGPFHCSTPNEGVRKRIENLLLHLLLRKPFVFQTSYVYVALCIAIQSCSTLYEGWFKRKCGAPVCRLNSRC